MQPKPLPPPTLANLYPPLRGYDYFDAASALPFAPATPAASVNRWWCAEHALLAYADGATVAAALKPHGYETHAFAHPASSTFAYAALARDHGILAFRGTEAMTPGDAPRKLGDVARDWLIDARVRRVAFGDGLQVHTGFAQALNAVWPQIEALLPASAAWWCVGHSLGGALAALAAVRMSQAGFGVAQVVTFGQPRTGDRAFAQRLGQLPVLRVVNACDLIPRLPPVAMGYEHAGTELHIDADKLRRYALTLREHLRQLPSNLKHGVGALTPIGIIDHAPLYYSIKCHNAALATG